MSRKQEIYKEMLFWAIPHIRNIQTQSAFRKAMDKTCFEEAELVHNLNQSILIEEFVDHDIYFLNTQAHNYYKNAAELNCPSYDAQCELIKELFSLVPEGLKSNLTWSGPHS